MDCFCGSQGRGGEDREDAAGHPHAAIHNSTVTLSYNSIKERPLDSRLMQSHSLRQYQVKNQVLESNTATMKDTVNDRHWRLLNPLGIEVLVLAQVGWGAIEVPTTRFY